jgi:WhiB family transcriptional regulator, redox-sensing transcriptional regulator
MEWRDHAACRDVDPELFFPLTSAGPSRAQTAAALTVCGSCVVRAECLDWSLEQKIDHGVWGGLSEEQRVVVLRQRRRSAASHRV